jgi:DUF1680 family protein
VSINGQKTEVTQRTDYPWNGHVIVSIDPEKQKAFTLKLRIPGWARNKPVPGDLYSYSDGVSGKVTLSVNGKEEEIALNKGYAEISREWTKGDKVELVLPMVIRTVVANKEVRDDSNKVAFEYGPVVYCAEEIDNKQISDISIANRTEASTEERTVLSDKVTAITGKDQGEEFTLIPYYIWSNRGVGKMKVWFPRTSVAD